MALNTSTGSSSEKKTETMRLHFIAAIVLSLAGCPFGFTPPPMHAANWLENLLGDSKVKTTASQREQLKTLLLQECRQTNPAPTRSQLQPIIDQLAPLSPVKASAASPELQAKWILEWTTEKEINFFTQQGFSENRSIYQTIEGNILGNMIPFVRGRGSFSVTGRLEIPDDQGPRTNFLFTEATIDLGEKWGEYKFPPIGKGWFDTVYLDEELRVDVNSRNDILICTNAAAEK